MAYWSTPTSASPSAAAALCWECPHQEGRAALDTRRTPGAAHAVTQEVKYLFVLLLAYI